MSEDTVKNGGIIQSGPLIEHGYTITGHVGEGAFGVVVMARSDRHHCQMAIKVIKKSSDAKKHITDWTVNNEKEFTYAFDHPYINGYYEIIETTKTFYIVMDYYKNGTLMDYYNEVSRTPEPLAYEWFAQLCAALEYVHGYGFAHRDVKMDNVLLDDRWRVRLSDFGMCTVDRPRQTTRGATDPRRPCRRIANRSVCGSAQYMSPELLAHVPYNGQLADAWAAGVLLYCLLAGRFPFSNECKCDANQVKQNQKEGYHFKPNESKRLSTECRLIFKKIFVAEKERKKISELKYDEWMKKMSKIIHVPYYL